MIIYSHYKLIMDSGHLPTELFSFIPTTSGICTADSDSC